MWLIRTTKSPSAVRDSLKEHVDSNDKLLILDVTQDYWATNFSNVHTDWMHGHMGHLRAA